MEQEKIERISFEGIEKQLAREGYLILEKGTKYGLELVYTPSEQEPVYLDIGGEKVLQPKMDKYVTYPYLELKEPILVGRHVFYHRGEKSGEYKFPLTNAKILHLMERSIDFQRDIINAFGITEEFFECEYPETLGDIDMFLFAHKHPDEAEQIAEIKNPYVDAISKEQERLNKAFVMSVLGEDVDLNDLTGVRIVTEL
jgi:hypothetical protein